VMLEGVPAALLRCNSSMSSITSTPLAIGN
jgi:hypothetical protein